MDSVNGQMILFNNMNICSRYHDEIVFDSTKCPLCEMMDKVDNQEVEIKNLTEQVKGANEQAAILVKDIAELQHEKEMDKQ